MHEDGLEYGENSFQICQDNMKGQFVRHFQEEKAGGEAPPTRMASTAELVAMTGSERKAHWQNLEQDRAPTEEQLACLICNRSFRPSVLYRHQPVCEATQARRLAKHAAAQD